MLRRWARIVVFGATVATLWLIALPAMASGPICDDRGATVIAPSPMLIVPEQSLIASDVDDCDASSQQASVHRHRVPAEPIVFSASDAALPTSALRVFAPTGGEARWFVDRDAPSIGVRTRVERPPRP